MRRKSRMKIECTVPSCSDKLDIPTQEEAEKLGWKIAGTSDSPPPAKAGRTNLGWCPKCIQRFSVE